MSEQIAAPTAATSADDWWDVEGFTGSRLHVIEQTLWAAANDPDDVIGATDDSRAEFLRGLAHMVGDVRRIIRNRGVVK